MFFYGKRKPIVGFLFLAFLFCPGSVWARTEKPHGDVQVKRALADLPALRVYYEKTKAQSIRRYVTDKDAIWQWAAEEFNHIKSGSRFYWNNASPLYDADACITLPNPSEDGFILIAPRFQQGPDEGRKKDFEELWRELVIQLLNMDSHEDYSALVNKAETGKVDMEEFVQENMKLEFLSFQASLRMYTSVWEPWMKSKGLMPDGRIWHTDYPSVDFVAWLARMKQEDTYLPEYYRKFYQDQIKPFLNRQRRR